MSRPTRCAALCLAVAALSGCNEDALRLPPPAASSEQVPSPAPSSSSSPETNGNAAFAVVARSPDAFELYPLSGALFVDAAGFLASLGEGGEGPLRQSPGLMKGLEKGAGGRLAGSWPDAAWLVAGESTQRWTGNHWAPEKLLHEHETWLALAPWDDGALLAIGGPGNDMRFVRAGGRAELAAGPRPAALPVAKAPAATLPIPSPAGPAGAPSGERGDSVEADEKEAPCKVRMKPRGVVLAGLPSGELYAAGYECEPLGHGGAIVERWAPKEARGTVEPLPRPENGSQPTPRGVLARSPREVLVYGSVGVPAAPYLARFDGKAWHLDTPPFRAGIDTLGAAADGTLWAASGGAVWRRAGAVWEKMPLPPGLAAQAVWPHGGDAWVAARQTEGKGRAVLLRTAREPRPELMRLPPRNAMAGSLASHKRFFATAACDKVYVELATLGPSKDPAGKATAIPKRFAALDPLLTGDFATLVPTVDDDGAELHLGVPVPSRDLGRKLSTYQEKNPGSAPGVFCYEPAGAGEGAKPRRR